MPKKLFETEVKISKDGRAMIPAFIAKGKETLLFQLFDDGTKTVVVVGSGPKVQLYGAFIGTFHDDRENLKYSWIIVNSAGVYVARGRSNSMEWVKKDITCPDQIGRKKLDTACTEWELPVYIDQDNIETCPMEARNAFKRIHEQYKAGLWPPKNVVAQCFINV